MSLYFLECTFFFSFFLSLDAIGFHMMHLNSPLASHSIRVDTHSSRVLIYFLVYRNSNPDDRSIVPDAVNGRKKFNVVYVVLESPYQTSMTVACKRINAAQVSSSIGVCAYSICNISTYRHNIHGSMS